MEGAMSSNFYEAMIWYAKKKYFADLANAASKPTI